MLRTLMLGVALVGFLALADQAEARGRRGGCNGGSCGVSTGGCYGGSCGVTTSACPGGQCQASNSPTGAAVVKQEAVPAAPQATVENGSSGATRYARWRVGGRRFR